MMQLFIAGLMLAVCQAAVAAEPPSDTPLQRSVEQLSSSIGHWNVVTEFLNEDGAVAKTVTGTYTFSWVVPDRVVAGRSDIPELSQTAGILFYVNEKKAIIEMVSVGADGRLWIMTGPLGGEERLSQDFPTTDGGTMRLRFTRYNISDDAFESRMDYTLDGGKTWRPGNHQTFDRVKSLDQ